MSKHMTTETTIAVSLLKVLGPILSILVNTPWKRNSRHEIDNSPFKLKGIRIKTLVEKAKGVLDNGKGPDLKSLTNLATILTEGEICGDIIKYISHRKFEENINWDNLKEELDNLEKKLNSELDKHLESQSSGPEKEGESSGHEKEGEMPGVRRGLLYLSHFPKKYVFNRQRISRLLVAHEFIAADKPPLQQLANWLELAERSWDGDGPPNHFLIGNDAENLTPTWPENHNLVREAIEKSIEDIENVIFHSSLIFLGKRNYTLKLNKEQFLFLKVLSLRNGRLENENYLKTLSLLKYLDLKNATVSDCSWLEGLEELEMLDLRYTDVEEIPEKCLEKLVKLQHLLLGYPPNKSNNWLAGAELNTTKLTTKLKTLRAIRWSEEINVSLEVADLSVTGLETGDLKEMGDGKSFWNVVEQFENLTRLGVAMTKNSNITLQDCPAKLKEKLTRLRMEGLHSGLERLDEFVSLVDLTLASHKRINIDSIPKLPKLFCLRLYSFCKEKTLTLSVQGFESLKKLVIGDMAKVETVEIVTDVIETVDTLKLCNLHKLSELIYRDSNSRRRLLSRRESETVPPHRESGMEVQKSIFLRGFKKVQFDKRPGLKIYHYDMDKQCYQEVHAI